MPRARPQLARRLRGRAWRAAPPTVGRLGHGGRLPGCGGGVGGSSGKRLVEVHLWWRRPDALWGNLDQGAWGLPFCQQHGKLCQEASPQGQRAGARRSWELSGVPCGPGFTRHTWERPGSLRFNSSASDIGTWTPDPVPVSLVGRVVRILAPSGNSMAQETLVLSGVGATCPMSLSSTAGPLAFLSLSEN